MIGTTWCATLEGGGNTPYNRLYGKAPPKRDTFLRVQVYIETRAGISQVEAYERADRRSLWL